jgi:hypothetical protein
MKRIDEVISAFRSHVAECATCSKFRETGDVVDLRAFFRDFKFCEVGRALSVEMLGIIEREEWYMRLLRELNKKGARS